jgi:hypothetical protein
MSRIGNILLQKDVFEKHRIDNLDDATMKAYSAGLLSKFGTLIVGGIGKNAATNWGKYTELKVAGVPFNYAIDNLQWFTEIQNKALKNQGKTTRKMQFTLTLFEAEVDTVKECYRLCEEHDNEECLAEDIQVYGGVPYWQDRTIGFTIPLLPKESEIFDTVCRNIMAEPFIQTITACNPSIEEMILHAFVEGQRGLQIGTDDLQNLREGHQIAA